MSPRPHVTLTYAQSLDGSIAAVQGKGLAISGAEALRMTHQLRAEHDAILVGIGTVLSDDPQLTVRHVTGENPQPIVVDSHMRFPVYARLLENVRKPWIVTTTDILTASNASEEISKVLKSKGATILTVPATPDGRVNLPALLNTLFTLGISRLMVEGGARIIEAFLRERLVDEVILTISPMWIGGLHAVANPLFVPSLPGQPNFPRLEAVTVEPCGSDWIVRGQLRP